MKHLTESFLRLFFRKELELRVKIFHVLAIAGVLICISTTIVSVIQGLVASIFINAFTGIISLALLIYSAKGGNQKFCYYTTIVCIFLILFPSLFFSGGGYTGGMGFSFTFAVVYTVYMLDGLEMFITTMFELVYYSLLCVFAYLHPETITPFASDTDLLIDVIVGFVLVSLSLAVTMYAQLRMYHQQRSDLEQARSEAELANRAKSTFLANMSHEIRTPIHVILSINELIRTDFNDSRIKAYNDKISDACELLGGMLDNVLDMSRIEAGKTELRVAPYRTAELKRMLELVGQSRCSSKQLEFRCICGELPSVLSGDVEHIRQIVVNLLSNAVKYTEKGAVTLEFSCAGGDTLDDVMLCIAVTDTGIGISREAIPTLFDAFTRADRPSTRDIEGTGLGLAIVKELCRLMHGTIRVESQIGWGSKFTVQIPQKLAASGEVSNKNTIDFIAPEGMVLVADDNLENLHVMRELLRRTQLRVDTVTSGEEALEAVKNKPYHVILLDYMMPGIDGKETLRRLRETEGFDTPVIVLTADARSETRSELLAAGFSEFLAKPIPWGELGRLLRKYLPEELVTVTTSDPEMSETFEIFCEEFGPLMRPYQIDLRAAMPFFDENLRRYLDTARIFLEHSENGKRTLAEVGDESELDALIYPIHSLKGRAKNLGLVMLADEAERIEKLCREGNNAEMKSLIPHLLYLYEQATNGLNQLIPRLEDFLHPTVPGTREHDAAECRKELQRSLDRMQRKSALECIDALLGMEPTSNEREQLEKMRTAVTGIRFDEASAIYVDYLQGGSTWTIEAES